MAVPPGLSPGINPAISSPVSWSLPDFNFSDPLGVGDTLSSYETRASVDPNAQVSIGGTEIPYGSSGNIAHDLVEHYYNSQQLTQDYGRPTSAFLGGLHEVRNAFDPGSTGFSSDDLLANYAGYMGFSPQEAAQANVWDHTQQEGSGLRGQGSWTENWQKLRNLGLPESSFPFIRNTFGGRIESEGPGVVSSDPQQKSIWQRALARLMPGAQAASLTPEEGGYYVPGIDQPALPNMMQPPPPTIQEPSYPTFIPDTPLRQHRQPHYPTWSKPFERGTQDDFSGVQWRIPDPVIPPSEYDFSVEDFRAPPVPSAPSGIHPRSGVPPQTPQDVGGDDGGDDDSQEEVRARNIARSVEKAVVPTKVIRANQKRAVSATKKALKAFEVHEEAKRSGSPAEISRTNRARVEAAIERKEADARNRSTQRYDQFAFEDRRGGRR